MSNTQIPEECYKKRFEVSHNEPGAEISFQYYAQGFDDASTHYAALLVEERESNSLLQQVKQGIVDDLLKNKHEIYRPYLISGNRSYSRVQLAEAISNNEKAGTDLIKKVLLLTVDLLSRNKIPKDIEEREKAMRWVKANEQTPINSNLVHIKYNTSSTLFSTTGFYENGKWYRQNGFPLDWFPNIEWLYEPITPQALKEGDQNH